VSPENWITLARIVCGSAVMVAAALVYHRTTSGDLLAFSTIVALTVVSCRGCDGCVAPDAPSAPESP
jgi:hypothetical protein